MLGRWGEPWYSWLQQHQSTDCQQEQVVTSNQIAYNSFASVAAHLQPTPSPPPGKEEEKREKEEKKGKNRNFSTQIMRSSFYT